MTLDFAGPAMRLVPGDIEAVAAALGVEPAVVHAVCDIEAAGSGFLADGRPKILFEARQFWLLTEGRFGHSNISSQTWDRSLYGAGGAHQYDRLAQALRLDREAALRSASFGAFQIMGNNFRACGFLTVADFVAAMVAGERPQFDAFAAFVKQGRLDKPLQRTPPAFAEFARGYNGPGYAENAYDVKLAAAWRKWRAMPQATANPAPRTDPLAHYATLQINAHGGDVAALQARLNAVGYRVDVDSDFGPDTMAAVVAFQKAHGLTPDGIVGPLTRGAINHATAATGAKATA